MRANFAVVGVNTARCTSPAGWRTSRESLFVWRQMCRRIIRTTRRQQTSRNITPLAPHAYVNCDGVNKDTDVGI